MTDNNEIIFSVATQKYLECIYHINEAKERLLDAVAPETDWQDKKSLLLIKKELSLDQAKQKVIQRLISTL